VSQNCFLFLRVDIVDRVNAGLDAWVYFTGIYFLDCDFL
jgi:hypothetical protein